MIVIVEPLIYAQRQRIVDLALTSRVPLITNSRELSELGGLLMFGPGIAENFRPSAGYVDKILKGAKPAELPGAAAHQDRLRRQPQGRPGPRAHHPAVGPRSSHRGDAVGHLDPRRCPRLLPPSTRQVRDDRVGGYRHTNDEVMLVTALTARPG